MMPAFIPSRKVVLSTSEEDGQVGNLGVCARSVAAIFNPCVLAIAGLAIAVALWGYGYKLSLYKQSTEGTKCLSVAKLYVEHRDPVGVTVSKLRTPLPTSPLFLALAEPSPEIQRPMAEEDVQQPLEAHGAATSGALIPFRAPPSSFLLN
jgi:hypothetical protein